MAAWKPNVGLQGRTRRQRPYLGRLTPNVRDLAERLETVKNDLCEMSARETKFEGYPQKGHDSITVYPRSELPAQAKAFTDR
jgi:hypothetical protein